MRSQTVRLLRDLREQRQVSLRQAARDLSLDPAYLSRVERGDVPPSDRVATKLASYYMRSPDEVLLAAGRVPDDIINILQRHPNLVDELRRRYAPESSA